jgi:DUF1365 family protein
VKSCIYEGQVRHTRSTPAKHQFSYRLFLMYLDLDELDAVFEKRWFWSANRPAFARFRRADHIGPLSDPSRTRSGTWCKKKRVAARRARFAC